MNTPEHHRQGVIPDSPATGMKPLNIVWQRLVTADETTCARCSATQQEIQRALDILKNVLRPLGIEPHLRVIDIDDAYFKAHPRESNRLWIADKPLEDWLDAHVGASTCCPVCAGAPCRTIEVGGRVFEAIPDHLIIKAALVAAAQLMMPSGQGPRSEVPA